MRSALCRRRRPVPRAAPAQDGRARRRSRPRSRSSLVVLAPFALVRVGRAVGASSPMPWARAASPTPSCSGPCWRPRSPARRSPWSLPGRSALGQQVAAAPAEVSRRFSPASSSRRSVCASPCCRRSSPCASLSRSSCPVAPGGRALAAATSPRSRRGAVVAEGGCRRPRAAAARARDRRWSARRVDRRRRSLPASAPLGPLAPVAARFADRASALARARGASGAGPRRARSRGCALAAARPRSGRACRLGAAADPLAGRRPAGSGGAGRPPGAAGRTFDSRPSERSASEPRDRDRRRGRRPPRPRSCSPRRRRCSARSCARSPSAVSSLDGRWLWRGGPGDRARHRSRGVSRRARRVGAPVAVVGGAAAIVVGGCTLERRRQSSPAFVVVGSAAALAGGRARAVARRGSRRPADDASLPSPRSRSPRRSPSGSSAPRLVALGLPDPVVVVVVCGASVVAALHALGRRLGVRCAMIADDRHAVRSLPASRSRTGAWPTRCAAPRGRSTRAAPSSSRARGVPVGQIVRELADAFSLPPEPRGRCAALRLAR